MSTLIDRPAELTVNEVIRLWPATVAVFNAYGIDACCGGAVPVREAAARDGADADALVRAILHDEASVRVVAFTLQPGQVVAPHRSSSTVVVHVLEGHALFQGEGEEQALGAGESAAYAPGELHGMVAGDEGVRFLATITPRP